MARGGSREGAGRKAGTPNKRTAELQAAVAATGETPLDYMLRVMRDPTVEHPRRDDMAKAASPYVHNRLAAIEHTGKDGADLIPPTAQDPRELAKVIVGLLKQAATDKPAE